MKRKLFTAVCFLLAAAMLPSGASAAGAGKGSKKEVGIQLYSVRSLIGVFGKSEGDYKPVLQALADMGYTFVEAASYKDGLLYGTLPQQFRRDVEATGMKVLSTHCTLNLSDKQLATGDFTEALKWWDECIAAHKAAGVEYIVVPSMRRIETLDGLATYCRYFNEVGARCKAAGIKFGYHNHSREFEKVEDRVMLDYMLENTDPDKVFFQMDVYWTVMGQASPVDYFTKYPGRFRLLHIKDRREVGQSGMVGYDAIFCNAATAGVEYIVVPSMRRIETLDGLATYCRYFNEVGARCKAAGIKFGYHNHSREFEKVEDRVMLDYMLENTDPDKVFFQMDVYWTVMGQASPVDYFTKYPGRFRLLHIKDRREVGQSGMVGYDAIFCNAATAGVENIIVEMEGSSYGDVLRSVRECVDYLNEAPFVEASYAK